MSIQLALIKRELWEHRALYIVPAVVALVMILLQITSVVSISAFDREIDLAMLAASNIGENERSIIMFGILSLLASLFVLEMGVLTLFYLLDSLYAERKDKSILFWRSMPVTDAETVLSKLVTAILVIPLITLGFIMATQLVVMAIISMWVGAQGANPWYLVWQAAPLFDSWASTAVFLLFGSLWVAPFYGWFLLVSAYTKRSPLLMALLPIIVLPMLERSILKTQYLTDALFWRTVEMPIFKHIDVSTLFDDQEFLLRAQDGISVIGLIDFTGFLTSPGLWGGLIVCGLFTTAAIYVRRYRDDS
jgi:ABC-2 type transport system permease protein